MEFRSMKYDQWNEKKVVFWSNRELNETEKYVLISVK